MTGEAPPSARRAGGLLLPAALGAAAATVLQVGWVDRGKTLAAEHGSASAGAVARALATTFGADAAAALLGLAAAVVLTLRAVRRASRAPEGLGALVPPTRAGRLALLLVASWAFLRWHASPGALFGFDLRLHAGHVALVADELRAGRWPAYSEAWYLGFPLLRWYGAAFYLPAGALSFALDDPRLAVKAVAATWHLLAAPAAYRLARTTGARPGVALLAGLAYGASPFFVRTLAHLGSLTAAPVVALAPLALAEAVRTGRGEGRLAGLRLGAVVALLAWAHPAYATQVGVLAALSFVAAAAQGSRALGATLLGGFVALATATLLASPLLTAWFVEGLPRAAGAPGPLALVRPGPPNPDALRFLVAWSPTPVATATGYASVVVLLLALAGALRGDAHGRRPWLFVLLAATVVAWCGPGFVRERALLLLPATLVPLVAVALGRGAARAGAVATTAVAALLLADLALGSLASPYRSDLVGLARDLDVEQASQGSGRTVLLVEGDDGEVSVGEWQASPESPLRVLTGGFREGAPAAYGMLVATLEAVAADPTLRDRALREHLGALGVTSVRRVGRRGLRPDAVRLAPQPRVRFADRADAGPASDAPTPDLVLAWAAASAPPEGSAPSALRRVVLGREGPALPDHDDPAPRPGCVTILDRRDDRGRDLLVRVPSAGWLRLDEAWLPGTTATVDGAVAPARPDVMGLVVVPVREAGEHRVAIVPPPPPRPTWLHAGLLSVLVTACGVRPRRRGARGAGATAA